MITENGARESCNNQSSSSTEDIKQRLKSLYPKIITVIILLQILILIEPVNCIKAYFFIRTFFIIFAKNTILTIYFSKISNFMEKSKFDYWIMQKKQNF